MKKYLILFVFLPVIVNAQSRDIPGEYIRQRVLGKSNLPEKYSGSPYFNEKFITGTVMPESKDAFKAELRYDGYNDEMQMMQGPNLIALLKLENDKVVVAGKTYQVYNFEGKRSYFVNLSSATEGTVLLKKLGKKYTPGQNSQDTYGVNKPASFRDDISYYIFNNKEFHQIKLSKKSFLKFFKQNKKELEAYIDSNKLRFKSEADFIGIINYYNTLSAN